VNQPRRRAVVGTVLGLLALAVALSAVIAGGPAEPRAGVDAAGSSGRAGRAAQRATQETVVATTTTTSPFGEPESFDVFATRNPFEPVIQVTPTAPPGTTTPGQTTVPTTPGTTAPGTTGPGTTQPPSFEPGAGQPVALLDVFTETDGRVRARVQVGSTVYTVSEGETFATSYQVVSLDPVSGCGQFRFGDSPFELCEGEQVIK
jgi:hypothetical protein